MKNIAILHYSCPPVVGGVEEIVRQQASLFRRHFYPVKVIAGKGGHFLKDLHVELNPLLASDHPEIREVQNAPEGDGKTNNLNIFTDRIASYLREVLFDVDVLIAHNVLTMPYNLPLTRALHRLAENDHVRVISWNHDSPYFYDNYPEYLKDGHWSLLRTYNRHIEYITISDRRAEQFKELYGLEHPLPVVPNGIDPIRFFRLEDTTWRLIKEQDLFSADLVLVQPSRLHPRKNIEKSIEVLAAFKKKNQKVKLLLTGAFDPHETATYDYYRKLIALAEQLNVLDDLVMVADYTFKNGHKLTPDRVTIRDLYLIADILFLPSKQEGFGIPLLEAGMIKLPIACSDIPPFRAIAAEDALYFDPDEKAEIISDKIERFLKDLKPQRMFRKVINRYVWDNIFHHHLKDLIEKDPVTNH
ncbi:MAG TPA: glycosyltransferase [Caldithrix abyssi]|uniref:Glycosyltransferase n=1 Tax=Caldithrix abyssi TaxID=187145 RepID=A0A7V5PQL9_CALAY|nr:glycosyltransferase [Caldithrix abyssi]